MNFLEQRIMKDGIVKAGNVLKVDSFLNHQMDISLMEESPSPLTLRARCMWQRWSPSPTRTRTR